MIAVALIIEDAVLVLRDGCLGVLEIKKQNPEFGDVKLETAFNEIPDNKRGNSTLIGKNLDIKLNTKYESKLYAFQHIQYEKMHACLNSSLPHGTG